MLTRASSAGAKSRVEMGVAIKPSAKEIHVTMENPTMFFKKPLLAAFHAPAGQCPRSLRVLAPLGRRL